MEFDANQLALDVGLRVLALAVGWISFVMIAWTVWRLRRPQPLRLITPLIAITGAVGSLAVYLVVAGVSVEPLPFAGLVAVGAVIGLVALWLVRVDTREGRLWVGARTGSCWSGASRWSRCRSAPRSTRRTRSPRASPRPRSRRG